MTNTKKINDKNAYENFGLKILAHWVTYAFFGFFIFVILSYQNACYRCENAENRNWSDLVLLSSTKLWRNIVVNEPLSCDENETRRNAGHVTMTIIKCIIQYRWRIKTRLNVVYKIKTMLKCLFIFVDQNETKRNVITLFRLVLSRFLCLTSGAEIQGCQVFANKTRPIATQNYPKTIPIAFRGGFPGKVRIPGAKYHVIGVASTRGHEKQPAATVLK